MTTRRNSIRSQALEACEFLASNPALAAREADDAIIFELGTVSLLALQRARVAISHFGDPLTAGARLLGGWSPRFMPREWGRRG